MGKVKFLEKMRGKKEQNHDKIEKSKMMKASPKLLTIARKFNGLNSPKSLRCEGGKDLIIYSS